MLKIENVEVIGWEHAIFASSMRYHRIGGEIHD